LILSIIVPFFNSENYLHNTLLCLKAVISNEIEFILIDDGSLDRSRFICQNFISVDDRFSYHYKKNGGLSDARNLGLKFASGKFITFLDSDDYVDILYYDYLIEYIIKHNPDLICTPRYLKINYKLIKNLSIKENIILNNREFREEIFKGMQIDFSVCNKVFNRESILSASFQVGLLHEDILFYLTYANKVKNIHLVNYVNYYYVQTKNSITRSSFHPKRMDLFYVNEILCKHENGIVRDSFLLRYLIVQHIYLAFSIWRANNITYNFNFYRIIVNRIFSLYKLKHLLILPLRKNIQLLVLAGFYIPFYLIKKMNK